MTGALRVFNNLGVNRIDMLTPYMNEVSAVVTEYLSRSGISVCASASFHSKSDPDIAALSPESIFEASGSLAFSAEALFIPFTVLRTSSIIDRLEARLGYDFAKRS